VSQGVVELTSVALAPRGRDRSVGHDWQTDDGVIAHSGDRFQAHVTTTADHHAQDFASAVAVGAHRNDYCHRDDPSVLANLCVGAVDPQISQGPSIGRSGKAFTLTSMSSQSRNAGPLAPQTYRRSLMAAACSLLRRVRGRASRPAWLSPASYTTTCGTTPDTSAPYPCKLAAPNHPDQHHARCQNGIC
jgi:hypothetical protein